MLKAAGPPSSMNLGNSLLLCKVDFFYLASDVGLQAKNSIPLSSANFSSGPALVLDIWIMGTSQVPSRMSRESDKVQKYQQNVF